MTAPRGRLIPNAPVGRGTWLGAGGRADLLFEPEDRDDLAAFLAVLPPETPLTVLGGGANILVRDGGIPGITVRLGRGFAAIVLEAEAISVGAATLDLAVARTALKAGRSGLEFLSGIPGTIGGGLRMNAGAYGREFKDVLISATALDRIGGAHSLDCRAMGFGYRGCGVAPDWVFVAARLAAPAGDPGAIAQRLAAIRSARRSSQPVRARTGGSTFANPPGDAAWRLVDAAGCRGLARGGALVSPRHANFLINTGSATAADLEALGEEVRRRVFETSGVLLEWEIRRIGRPAAGREAPERWPR
jgi:UDP-N-acetylmuramate dehydrogenase